MIEEWRVIEEFPDYEISTSGNIQRVCTSQKCKRWRKGYFKKIGTNGRYPKVVLYNLFGYKNKYVHDLLLTTFVGACPKGHECNHKDGNKRNYDLSNLEWITHSENELHAHRIGLKESIGCPGRVGILHPLHKLENSEVRLIRNILSTKRRSQTSIAKEFNVHPATISKIYLRTRWKHL